MPRVHPSGRLHGVSDSARCFCAAMQQRQRPRFVPGVDSVKDVDMERAARVRECIERVELMTMLSRVLQVRT